MSASEKGKNRKRKHSENSIQNGKVQKTDGEEDIDGYVAEATGPTMNVEEQVEEEFKASGSFNMKRFREKLKSGNFITELRHFLQEATSNSSLIGKYVNIGGKPLELIEALERIDKTQLFHVSYVFQIVQLVLIEILSNATQLTQAAIQSCSYLLNKHRSCIESLLNSRTSSHRRAVLKLLTAIVALEPQFGRDILSTFNVAFSPETLKHFASHIKAEIDSEEETVRTCYIHFIMAYLIEGNVMLVRNILDRNELIVAVLSGLVYDTRETVCLVLSTLLKYVLKSELVSKTKKVQVFGSEVVTKLVRLFNWKGPTGFNNTFDKKQTENLDDLVDKSELELVSKATYEFLNILLCSRKHGIAFQCLGFRRLKSNNTQKAFLSRTKQPWDNAYLSDLAIDVLKACPELSKVAFQRYNVYINVKQSNFFQTIDWFCKMTEQMTPSILRIGAANMTPSDMVNHIQSVCMGHEILHKLALDSIIRNEKIEIRFAATRLLRIMFQQCNNFLFAISEWNVFNATDLRKIKFDMINHIFVCAPSVQKILLSLHMTLKQPEEELMFQHLEVVLDILLIIAKSIPSFIEQSASVMNYMTILRPIYELNRDNGSSTRIELKAVQLILTMEPKALSVNMELFNDVIDSFLNVFIFGGRDEQREAHYLLRNVFQNTGFFENGVLEIDLWLESLKLIDETELADIKNFLIDSLVTYDVNEVTTIESNQNGVNVNDVRNVKELFYNIDNGLTLNGFIDIPAISNFYAYVVSKLDEESDDSVKNYVANVGFLLFHYQPEPKSIMSIMKAMSHNYRKYMKKWIDNGKPGKSPEYQLDILVKFYDGLLSRHSSFLDVFQSTSSGVKLKINGVEAVVDESLSNETKVMIFVYIAMFMVVHLNEQSDFDEKCTRHFTSYMQCFIEVLHQLWINESKDNKAGFEVEQVENSFMTSLKYIFCSRFYFINNFNIFNKTSVTSFIVDITKCVTALDKNCLDELLVHYRTKITNQIEQAVVQTNADGNVFKLVSNSDNILDILDVFSLKHDHLVTIIESIVKLPTEQFTAISSQRTIFYDILGFALKRVADLKVSILSNVNVGNISKLYSAAIHQSNEQPINERFEEAIHSYLKVFYHSIGAVSDDVFTAILQSSKPSKLTTKIAILLLERNRKLSEIFIEMLPTLVTRKELTYPLLNVIVSRSLTLESNLLSTLYGEFKNGIIKTIEKPQKAGVIYKENIFSTLYLIEHCMPLKECIDFTKKSLKFDSAELYQLQIIKAIHLKALSTEKPEQQEQIFMNFVNTFVQLFAILLKKDSLDYTKINGFAVIISHWLKLGNNQPSSFDKVVKTPLWSMICRTCLKVGIQSDVSSDDSSILLKIFGFLCDIFYTDNSDNDEPAKLYEMALSHSSFFDLALRSEPTSTKTNLMYALFVLLKKNQSSIKSNHVPVFLSAYQAKLSQCDQWILAILQKYEQCGIKMHEFKPFVWGESAVSFYSLRDNGTKTNLNQESPVMQVMSLIDPTIAEKTISNFPIWRKLDATSQVPDVEFNYYGIVGNEHLDMPNIAVTRLEKCVLTNKYDPELSDVCYRKQETYDDLYDPSFFIPLMSMSFAPESFARPLRPAQNGLLAMTFAALSCKDKALRLATGNALQRYRSHLESARFIDSKIWLHLFECIQNGLGVLTNEMRKTKKSRIPRVPYVAGVFLARTINILMNPLNELYRPLSGYLTLQNTFNFLTVPEFNVLFNSPDVNHVVYRHFILEVIRDGLKCGSDFTILMSQNIFKAILGFYNTSMATRDTNLIILTVINAAVKIPKCNKILIEKVGLLPWLNGVVDNVEFFQFDIIEGLCNVFNSIWFSLKFDQREYSNINDVELRLLSILLKLIPNLSTRTSLVSFAKFLNVCVNLLPGHFHFITEPNIDHLISCAKEHLTDSVLDLNFIRESDETFCEKQISYVKQLRELKLDETVSFIDVTMREIIIGWLKCKKTN